MRLKALAAVTPHRRLIAEHIPLSRKRVSDRFTPRSVDYRSADRTERGEYRPPSLENVQPSSGIGRKSGVSAGSDKQAFHQIGAERGNQAPRWEIDLSHIAPWLRPSGPIEPQAR